MPVYFIIVILLMDFRNVSRFLAGVAVHGFGNWREILDDNRFGPAVSDFDFLFDNCSFYFFPLQLINRTNVNLKDRYRTLEKKGLL